MQRSWGGIYILWYTLWAVLEKKSVVRLWRTSRFSCPTSNFLLSLAQWARAWGSHLKKKKKKSNLGLAQCKKSVRAACWKAKLEFKYFFSPDLYTWVGRGTVRMVSCPRTLKEWTMSSVHTSNSGCLQIVGIVARGAAENISGYLSALLTIQVHPELDGRTLDVVHCFYNIARHFSRWKVKVSPTMMSAWTISINRPFPFHKILANQRVH